MRVALTVRWVRGLREGRPGCRMADRPAERRVRKQAERAYYLRYGPSGSFSAVAPARPAGVDRDQHCHRRAQRGCRHRAVPGCPARRCRPGEFDVTVVANGCTDATAQVAAARAGVRVLDLPSCREGGGAQRRRRGGGRVSPDLPRRRHRHPCRRRSGRCGTPSPVPAATPSAGVLAVTARRELDVSRSPLLVRSYLRDQLPIAGLPECVVRPRRHRAVGRGTRPFRPVPRRRRRRSFPGLPLRRGGEAGGRLRECPGHGPAAHARPAAPPGPGAARQREHARGASRRSGQRRRWSAAAARTSWLRDVALRNPALIPAATCYAAITLTAAILARLPRER